MPFKDPIKNREYKRLWIAKKRSRQNNVEPQKNNFVEPLKSVEPEKVINDILQPLPPCQICPNMNAKYGTNKTYCLNCDLKEDNREIVPLGLVQQLQEKIFELKEQLETVATLPAEYIDSRESELKEKHQKKVFKLETKIKELELKIISLQEINQILRKDLDYWQEK